jgi:hypothetical protein
MKLYALKIRKSNLGLITLLNGGVEPKVEKKESYFIFDATSNSDVPNVIVSGREFLQTYDIMSRSPLLLSVKQYHDPEKK